MKNRRVNTAVRLSPEARLALEIDAQCTGETRTAILEDGLRTVLSRRMRLGAYPCPATVFRGDLHEVAAGYIGWRRAVAQEDGYRLERLDCPEIYEASPVLFGPKYGELYQVRGPDGEVVNEHVIRACQEEAVAVCTMMAEARGREGVSNG